jgi:hypothetical protein
MDADYDVPAPREAPSVGAVAVQSDGLFVSKSIGSQTIDPFFDNDTSLG